MKVVFCNGVMEISIAPLLPLHFAGVIFSIMTGSIVASAITKLVDEEQLEGSVIVTAYDPEESWLTSSVVAPVVH
jgi:hypothetical protein